MLSNLQRFKGTKHGAKAARKANKKIQITAGTLVREIARKLLLMSLGRYLSELNCKEEYYCKSVEIAIKSTAFMSPISNVIRKANNRNLSLAAKPPFLLITSRALRWVHLIFTQILHDSKTIPDALEQYERLNGEEAKEVFVDRGYRAIKQYGASTIHVSIPDKDIYQNQTKKA